MSKDWQEQLQEEQEHEEKERWRPKGTHPNFYLENIGVKFDTPPKDWRDKVHGPPSWEQKILDQISIIEGHKNLHEEEALRRHEEETNAINNKPNQGKAVA
jgi:hypothetical protein